MSLRKASKQKEKRTPEEIAKQQQEAYTKAFNKADLMTQELAKANDITHHNQIELEKKISLIGQGMMELHQKLDAVLMVKGKKIIKPKSGIITR